MTTHSLPNTKRYYPAIDGLRGLAILLVVFLHNFGFLNYFFFGWLGVDLFFVISGFLITGILLDAAGKPGYLKNFYMRRVLRIFPVYYLMLFICLFLLPVIPSLHYDPGYYFDNQFYMWTYLQNWLFIFQAPDNNQMLLHTWSLAVEEQFYLFWPLVILLLRKPKRILFFSLALLIFTGVFRFLVWDQQIETLSYSSLFTFTRIDGLCIGAMISVIIRIEPELLRKYMPYIVLLLAGINFGFYFINGMSNKNLPFLAFVGYTTFAMLFGLLVFEAAEGRSKLIELLFNNSFMRFFGRISYGFYVFHWPVYIIFFDRIRSQLLSQASVRAADLLAAILCTAIAILISMISYRYFERPFLKLKAKY
jgi:peptidoglycan/LPS O-acetylase OafA/YrhL